MSRSLYCLVEKAEYNKKNTTTYKLLSKEGIGDKHNLLTLRDFFDKRIWTRKNNGE